MLGTTRLTIMRGEEADDAGDISDVGIPVYRHVPADLVEQSHQTFDPASSTRRTIRTIMCVVPSYTDVTNADTLLDERTGNYFVIESITMQPTLGPPPDLILTLRQVTGVSVASGPEPVDAG